MDSKPPQNAPRKLKFMPKAAPRRIPKPEEVKSEKAEDVDAAQAMNLMRQFNERSMRTRPKIEKKVQASQIAFGFGAASNSLKSYGSPKVGGTSNRDQGSAFNGGGVHASGLRDKEYIEPWDYYSYYPVTLPMRRPYSGDPAILDGDEFGEASESATFNDKSVNPAVELGLMEENVEASTFFLQLPPTMPIVKRSATADGNKIKENPRPSGGVHGVEKACTLNELPAGFMGKMLVYKSGSVKLNLGDTLYDVSSGMDCVFAQDVVAINTAEKHCCVITEINKRATLTPDVDAIISNIADL